MKTTENIKLTTAGELLGELEKYKKNHWDDCVVAWLKDDERTFGVVGMGNDKDGDLRIIVEVVDDVLEGFWTVEEVISSLECKGKDARVYFAGEGLYLAIDSRGGIFTEADDDDAVGCWVTVIGEYEHEPQPESNKKREIHAEAIALLLILVAAVCWFGYNIYAMIAGVGGPLWEKIFGIVVCCIVIVVSGCTLYYSKK